MVTNKHGLNNVKQLNEKDFEEFKEKDETFKVKQKVAYSNFDYKSVAMIDFAHIYGEIINIFRDIHHEDMDGVISYKFENINEALAIRKYLMKTPKDILTEVKPILDINVSLDIDYEGDVFSPLPFNTDMSHIVNMNDITNKFLMTYQNNRKKFGVFFSFKRIKLNIELNIIEDSRQMLLNIYNYWKTIRYPNRMYRRNIVMNFPVPDEAYKEYCYSHGLNPDNKKAVYKHMKRHSLYPLQYKKNLSTGNYDIFFIYDTIMDFTPKGSNLSNGVKKESIYEDFRLTRSFDVVVNIPSICYIKMNREREFLKNNEASNDGIDTEVTNWVPYDWEDESDRSFTQILNCGYEFEKSEEKIDCRPQLYGEFIDFYKFLRKRVDLNVGEYIKIKYFKNKKVNKSKSHYIDEEKLTIHEFNADFKADYKIAAYVDLEFYNRWLEYFEYSKEENFMQYIYEFDSESNTDGNLDSIVAEYVLDLKNKLNMKSDMIPNKKMVLNTLESVNKLKGELESTIQSYNIPKSESKTLFEAFIKTSKEYALDMLNSNSSLTGDIDFSSAYVTNKLISLIEDNGDIKLTQEHIIELGSKTEFEYISNIANGVIRGFVLLLDSKSNHQTSFNGFEQEFALSNKQSFETTEGNVTITQEYVLGINSEGNISGVVDLAQEYVLKPNNSIMKEFGEGNIV